jgi:hypothetical protein
MPYKCYKVKDKYECRNKETDKVHGTHESLEDCMKQLRALYHAEGGGKFTRKEK